MCRLPLMAGAPSPLLSPVPASASLVQIHQTRTPDARDRYASKAMTPRQPFPALQIKRERVQALDALSLSVLALAYAIWMLWFLSGNERMRWPVALKNALSTAGAATQMVGSPTPPQGSLPPVGMTIDSTFGICAIRIES